jgi:hypothetical protein
MKTINVKILNQEETDILKVGFIYKGKEYSISFLLDGNSYIEKYINTKDTYYKDKIFNLLYIKIDNDKIYLSSGQFDLQISRIRNEIISSTPYKTYLIKDCVNGFYKIGKSRNPKIREKTLQHEKPTIKIVKIFDQDIEKILHEQYKEQRLRGEWFNLNNIQVKYICSKYGKEGK